MQDRLASGSQQYAAHPSCDSPNTSRRFAFGYRVHPPPLVLPPLQVFGWDTSKNSYQKSHSGGRSYISAISEVITDSSETCDGRAKNDMGEARLDIEDSEIAYLGYYHAESYGLSWKVMGRVGGYKEY